MKILIVACLVCCTLLVGCASNHYAYDFNATSNSDCIYQCEELMFENRCFEASPSYQSSFLNGEQTNGICSCHTRSCLK